MVPVHERLGDDDTVASRAAAAMRVHLATLSASGFSHSTCLPAAAALIAHSACRWFGSGM